MAVPLWSLRTEPLATWGDDYLSLERADLPEESVLLERFYWGSPEPFT